jgi:hypothetical protein
MPTSTDLHDFLSTYPPAVQQLVDRARELVKEVAPGAEESLDLPARMLAYSYGPGYKGMLFSVIPSRAGVKIGIVRGASLDDPDALLAGSGKVHRHVAFGSMDDFDRPGVRELLERAVAEWREWGEASAR